MNYIDALKLVHRIVVPLNYCEIGCRFGHSLALSRAPAVAIDPDFDIRTPLIAPTRLYRKASDEFFATEDIRAILGGVVDFAFIDGMHLAEYALRDFINLEKVSRPQSIIAIDDLLPEDIAYATRERKTREWTGDVYRIIPILKYYRPDLEIRVYDVEMKGFGIVTNLDPSSPVLRDRYKEIEGELATGRWTLSSVEAIRNTLAVRPTDMLEPDLRRLAQIRAAAPMQVIVGRRLEEAEAKLAETTREFDKLVVTLKEREAHAAELAARLEAGQIKTRELTAEVKRQEKHARELTAEVKRQEEHARDLTAEMRRQETHATELAAKLKEQEERAAKLRERARTREREIRDLKRSVSWRATAPLRGMAEGLRWLERGVRPIGKALRQQFGGRRYRIGIKVPVPTHADANEWGDYHFAVALSHALRRLGHSVRIDLLSDWHATVGVDVVLVLRGRRSYKPKPGKINLMWNISHPDKVTREEYERYDHVFVASTTYARRLSAELRVPVSALLQCTDAERFKPGERLENPDPLLFVGNSRNVYRRVVRDAIAADLSPAVYGTHWEQFIDDRYLKGTHIPNEDLARHYSSAAIVLNDHWDSMVEHGFLSNRLFDAGAAGAFVISDQVAGLEEVFGDAVVTYDTPADLGDKVRRFMADAPARAKISGRLRELVVSAHTFDHRASEIIDVVDRLHDEGTLQQREAAKLRENNGTRFGRELQRIVQRDVPAAFTDALRESEARLAEMAARLKLRTELPLVSIIMPTHNRAKIIRNAIASVLEQEYSNWELLICDDGSTDKTESVIKKLTDSRVRYLKLPKQGAAAARNAGLKEARGTVMAYLDSDNLWHPNFLVAAVLALLDNPGRSAVYADFIDYRVNKRGKAKINAFGQPQFHHENLLKKNFIDLNSFVHRRELYDCFGGFDERLTRRQDYDLALKYTWLRDPLHIPCLLTLYQRNDKLAQITRTHRKDDSCIPIIDGSIATYFRKGLPSVATSPARRITILSWDMSRNHFSKPYALAEALSEHHEVQLISFRFFEDEIFPPLRGERPRFETLYLPGSQFPDFSDSMARALAAIRGDVIYAVKPRLPSLGLALLANYQRGTPVILEINDLETVVTDPREGDRHREVALETVDLGAKGLLNPYSDLWSQLLDPLAKDMPVVVTHNRGIDQHFGNRCLYLRNIKDENVYDPALYDRERIRTDLGFTASDRIILFAGLLRKHKGIFELVELVKRLDDSRYKLLFVGSRPSPDQQQLVQMHGDVVKILPSQDREAMARINLAADVVVLWLNPDVPASRFQMPYKATDAFAMGTPVIANDISDLGDLGRQGYLRVVPFGDWDNMIRTISDLFDRPEATTAQREAARRLYLRQFSYAAARGSLSVALQRAMSEQPSVLPVAERFARGFDAFYRASRPAQVKAAAPADEALSLLMHQQ